MCVCRYVSVQVCKCSETGRQERVAACGAWKLMEETLTGQGDPGVPRMEGPGAVMRWDLPGSGQEHPRAET